MVTVVTSMRLKQVRMELINASWGIAIVQAPAPEYPFDFSRASKTILRVNTLREVSDLLSILYRDVVVHPESCCGDIVARPGCLT